MELIGNKLQANTNMFIAKKDLSEVYGNYIYLGIYDSENNYVEVSETEKARILEEQEIRRAKEEEERRG